MAIEPPSQTLIHSLRSLNLATEVQLRACEKHLRNLVRDLPAFDSVWIDALVQGEILTPFQAKRLVQSPESLRQGSHVLVDRLPHDGWPVRYRAVPLKGGQPVAIAVLPVTEAELPAARDRFQRHVASVQGLSHRNLCLATSIEDGPESLHAISALPVGEPLDELFVRRGRFPADVVEEIARQALDGLSRLEQAGTLHGDLRLRNLLLGPSGRLQIINAGLLAAVHPQITIHGTLPIACHVGTAPELIGGRTERSPATEMYALGCLLWHLLAGRSPYLPADRLEQLAAHQSGTIPDVRTIAPDTPSGLAALIARLVARHPSERYRSLIAAAGELGSSQARGRARLSQFQASFQSMVPVRLGRAAKSRRPAGTLLSKLTVGVLLGTAALFLFPGAGRSLMQSVGRMLHATQEVDPSLATRNTASPPTATTPTITAAAPTALPLRETTKHSGMIVLNAPGPYAASAFSHVDDLRITAAEGVRPVIEVGDQPLRLAGQRVFLENITLRRGPHAAPDIPLIQVDTQILNLKGCELLSGPLVSGSMSNSLVDPSQAAIRWKPLNASDIQGGMIECENCLFVGGAAVVLCDAAPQSVEMTNSACLGTGPLCEVVGAPSVRMLQLLLTRTTLRQTGPLFREHQVTALRQTPVSAKLRQSVLDLQPAVAVVEALGAISSQWTPKIDVESNGSYLTAEAAYVGIRTHAEAELIPLDPERLDVEGLLVAEVVKFTGNLSPQWNSNVVASYKADVQADEQLGIAKRERSVRGKIAER